MTRTGAHSSGDWLDAFPLTAHHLAAMALVELSPTELSDCARGMRCLRDQALKDAERQAGSSSARLFLEAAERHEKLAKTFEAVREAAEKTARKR